jgi:hypothetical protein
MIAFDVQPARVQLQYLFGASYRAKGAALANGFVDGHFIDQDQSLLSKMQFIIHNS